jgi:hypothetical protein
MTARHRATEHHTAAAAHHAQAAMYHRESSKHYQIGKDYAHAAHQALIAHGHSLHAIDSSNEAGKYYAQHDGTAKYPEPIARFTGKALVETKLSGADHHAAAADHHEQAARHHDLACKHCDARDYGLAAHEAQVAHGHAQHSVFHGNEAAKHHVEHYGKSGPTAEIS